MRPTSSSGVPPCRIRSANAARSRSRCRSSGVMPSRGGSCARVFAMMFVRTGPGQSTLTPMPKGASWRRIASDSPTTANFEVVYIALLAVAARPAAGGGIDDVTVAALDQARNKDLHTVDHTVDVDAHHPVPQFEG